MPLKPILGGLDSVAPSIVVVEQSQSNEDCSFHSSFAFFALGRSYHHNVSKSVTDVVVVCFSMPVQLMFTSPLEHYGITSTQENHIRAVGIM